MTRDQQGTFRTAILGGLSMLGAILFAHESGAQPAAQFAAHPYPSRPIRVVVP